MKKLQDEEMAKLSKSAKPNMSVPNATKPFGGEFLISPLYNTEPSTDANTCCPYAAQKQCLL